MDKLQLPKGFKLGENDKKILAIIGTILILVLGWQFVLSPKLDDVNSNSDKLKEKQSQRDVALAQYNNISNLKLQGKKMKKQLKKYTADIPKNLDVENVLKILNKFAKDAGVPMTGLTFTEAAQFQAPAGMTTDPGFYTVTINFTANGNYNQITKLMDTIENFKPKLKVSTFTVAMGDKGQLSAQFALNMFAYNPTGQTQIIAPKAPKVEKKNIFGATSMVLSKNFLTNLKTEV